MAQLAFFKWDGFNQLKSRVKRGVFSLYFDLRLKKLTEINWGLLVENDEGFFDLIDDAWIQSLCDDRKHKIFFWQVREQENYNERVCRARSTRKVYWIEKKKKLLLILTHGVGKPSLMSPSPFEKQSSTINTYFRDLQEVPSWSSWCYSLKVKGEGTILIDI